MNYQVLFLILVIGVFGKISGKAFADNSNPASHHRSEMRSGKEGEHGLRSREINDDSVREVSQEESEELQESLNKVFKSLHWLNQGREISSATN